MKKINKQNVYNFNTYRKLKHVISLVSQMVHYPAAIQVINSLVEHFRKKRYVETISY